MNAHARLIQLEEKHGCSLPFLMRWDILNLISDERKATIDRFEQRLNENRQGVET